MSTPTILNSPEAKRRINGAFQDISDLFVKIEAARDTIKQIVADYSEEFQIEKKDFTAMAKTFHKGTFVEEVKEKTEREIMYETITGQRADVGETYNGEDGE